MAGDALRQLIASFQIEVDPTGALAKGNRDVDALRGKLEALDAAAKPAAAAVGRAFEAARAKYVQRFQAPSDAGLGQFGPVRPGIGDRLRGVGGAVGGGLRGVGASAASAFKWVTSLHGALISLGASTAVRGLMQVVDHLGGIGEAAAKLGVSGSEFQRLDVLARQNATSVQALGTAFRTLATTAVNPTEESTEALRRLGVQVKADDGTFKTRQDLFFETATALADVEDTTVRAALAQKLYGRSALELAPLLAAGRAGIEAQRAELEKMPVAADSAIAAADALGDRWATVSTVLLGQFAPVLEDTIIPAFQQLTTWLLAAGEAVAGFLKDSHYLQYLGIFLKTMATPLRVVFNGFQALFKALGGGDLKLAGVADAIGRVTVALSTLMNLPFLLAADFQYYLQGRDSAIGRAIEGLTKAFTFAWDLIKTSAATAFDWILARAADVGPQIARALVPGYAQAEGLYNAVTGGGSIPVPGGAAPAPAERQGTTVIEAPRTVTVNMGANASPGEVAKRVGVELERDRAAVAAGVP